MLNPYKIVDTGKHTYWFQTDAKVEYVAYFSDSSGYFLAYPEFNDDMLGFTFEPFGEDREAIYLGTRVSKALNQKHDPRIIGTVSSILIELFESNPNKVVSMICEDNDGLARCRNRLFNSCFHKVVSLLNSKISKYDLQIEGQGYISIFIKDSNPHHKLIVHAFQEIPYRIAVSKNPQN